jgi:putative transposase
LSVRRQCELVGLNRSTLYYEPAPETAENLELMRLIDEQYTAHPFYGSRRITQWLVRQGHEVNRKRVQRLMRVMGLEAIYPKPNLSAGRGHKVYPYLLRGVAIERVESGVVGRHHVHSAALGVHVPGGDDRLVQPVRGGWRLSNTLDGSFCQEMLEEALGRGKPEVFNTDQGVQFTAGRGRAAGGPGCR